MTQKKYHWINTISIAHLKYEKIRRKKNDFKKIHLIDSKNLSKKEILHLIKESKKYIFFNKQKIKKYKILEGRTIFNLFFEDSTRTRTSFEVAAKRLGADLINVALKDSSINKGENFTRYDDDYKFYESRYSNS